MFDNMIGIQVLFQAATKSMHSTTVTGLLSVETTVCITNVVTHWSALNRSNQVYSHGQSVNLSQAGLICNCGKINFLVEYSSTTVFAEKYLPFVHNTFKSKVS